MSEHPKIYIAGHQGMVGSAIFAALRRQGQTNILVRTHAELDLSNQAAVHAFFASDKPDQVYLAAARVGGIQADTAFPAEFIYQNLMIAANVIHEAWRARVSRLLFLASSCIYPRRARQPMREEALLTGTLASTTEPYAIAKIAGIKLCESYNRQYDCDYRILIPTNLYGPGDNYHPEYSHVVPALIGRFHAAKVGKAPVVTVWGTGSPRREFLHVSDLASASVHVMNLDKATYDAHAQAVQGRINVGYGEDITIRELAEAVAETVAYQGAIEFDLSRPDGTPRKLMDSSRIAALGWRPTVCLKDGLATAYRDFVDRVSSRA